MDEEGTEQPLAIVERMKGAPFASRERADCFASADRVKGHLSVRGAPALYRRLSLIPTDSQQIPRILAESQPFSRVLTDSNSVSECREHSHGGRVVEHKGVPYRGAIFRR